MTVRRIYRGAWGTHSVTSTVATPGGQVRADCGLLVPEDLVELVDAPFYRVVTCEPCLTDDLEADTALERALEASLDASEGDGAERMRQALRRPLMASQRKGRR